MNRFKVNLISNFLGTGWFALMQLFSIPLYIHFMGVEAYGLIGFYVTLQTTLRILDFGLSPTMNREMARYSVQMDKANEVHDLARTLEASTWALGLVVGFLIWISAPFIAAQWIKSKAIPIDVIEHAIMSMSVLVVLQGQFSLYQGGLLGLQRQVLLNSIKITTSTINTVGAVLVLWLLSPTVQSFFWWQIISGVMQVILIRIFFWRCLPPPSRSPRFALSPLRNVWHFATGMSGITLAGLILTQTDKIILSKLLSLDLFGYYMVASTFANCVIIISSPVFNAAFPRFTTLVAIGDERTLKQLYHRIAQVLAVLTLAPAAVVMLFSLDILSVWSGNIETARHTAPLLSILVAGTALNGLMHLPYALQLAYGRVDIALYINTAFIITHIPALVLMTKHYGTMGAAVTWAALNTIYVMVGIPITHRRVLKGETRQWFVQDLGLPLAGAAAATWMGRELISSPMSPLGTVVSLTVVTLFGVALASMAAPQVRTWIVSQCSRI